MKIKGFMKLFSLLGFIMVCCCFTSVFAIKQVITDEVGTQVMTVDESNGTLWIEPIPDKDCHRQSESFFIEQNLERYLYKIYPDFLPKCIFYKGVSYEYRDDGVVIIAGSSGAQEIVYKCVKLLGVIAERQSGYTSTVDKFDSRGTKYQKPVHYEATFEKAKRPFHTLHIIGDFTVIPRGFFGGMPGTIPLKALYINKTNIRTICDAFHGISRDTLAYIELPVTIKHVHSTALDAFRECPNLNQSAKYIVDNLYSQYLKELQSQKCIIM